MRKKPRFKTSTTTLPHQIEVEGFRLEPYATIFPHQIEVEGLVVRKKPRIEQVEGLAGQRFEKIRKKDEFFKK